MIFLFTLLSLFLIFYAYFGYPLLLAVLPSVRTGDDENRVEGDLGWIDITVIVTVHNEVAAVEKKILSVLEMINSYCAETGATAELIVASDCSDDGSDDVVEGFSRKGVKLVRTSSRGGKENAQKLAALDAKGEVIFFTDVRADVGVEMLQKIAPYFRNAEVGAVSTTDRVVSSSDHVSGESLYVRYEMLLRKLESKFNSLVGLSGSGFAVRRKFCENMRSDIPSDFALLLQCREAGLIGVHGNNLECRYEAVQTEEQEFTRKVRTVLRGITAFFQSLDISFLKSDPVFAWQLISHKFCRWLVPWCLIVAGIGIVPMMFRGFLYFLFGFGMLVFFALAALGYFRPEYRKNMIVKIPLFFLNTNLAILFAWIKYFRGERQVSWPPSKRPA